MEQVDICLFESSTTIVSLTTGAKPDLETKQQILSAHRVAADRAKYFIDERLRQKTKHLDAVVPKQRVPFFDKLSKSSETQK